MTPAITPGRRIHLVGMDFYGDPFENAGGWCDQNAVGQLWQRFCRFFDNQKGEIQNLASDSGYELWMEGESEKDRRRQYLFVGVEVSAIDDIPLELVAKTLPETRYAVFTLKGTEFRLDWSAKIFNEWLPAAGFEPSHHYLFEYYDSRRFKGIDNPESELDIYVPIK